MIDPRTIQVFVSSAGFPLGKIDGDIGPKTIAAGTEYLKARKVYPNGWPNERLLLALQQQIITDQGIDLGKVDGLWGPRSQYAMELFQNKMRDVEAPPEAVAHMKPIWPRQRDMIAFYGQPGQNQTLLTTPYPLYLDWDLGTKISRFSIHKKCSESAERAMASILNHYGLEGIRTLGLDQFGGCLNVRKMRGGSSWSTHAWGAAIDWDADRNSLRMNHRSARFAKPEFKPFLDSWEKEGWISLGRERDFDWQHVQAARL